MNFILLSGVTFGIMEFFSIDLSNIIFVLLNTLLTFLLVKHWLFKPVNRILDSRRDEVADTYKKADEAMENAKLIEEKYTGLLQSAREESADIVKAATQKAQLRSDDIISEAKTEASNVMIRANEEIEREKRRAKKEIRTEISEIAVMVAEKVVGREVTDADQFRLVDEFIDNVGDLV